MMRREPSVETDVLIVGGDIVSCATAQFNLGNMYYNGHGVPQDHALAHMWFNLAVAQGYEMGEIFHDDAARKMTPAKIMEAQRLAREYRPRRARAAVRARCPGRWN
jgi:TPR repeat protein